MTSASRRPLTRRDALIALVALIANVISGIGHRMDAQPWWYWLALAVLVTSLMHFAFWAFPPRQQQ